MKPRNQSRTNPNSSRRRMGLLVLLLVTGHASAQWQVTDRVTQQGLEDVENALTDSANGTNKHLNDLYDQQKIGDSKRSANEDPDNPEVTLEKGKPSELVNYGVETRCPEPKSSGKIPRDQWTICKEIVKTELAQYNYALAMRDVAVKQRQERLKAIEENRSSLDQDKNTGKLHSNSNELLALLARMEVDRQQYLTYMDAYAARLKYLHALRESLGEQAINRSSTLGDVAVGAGALVLMKQYLDGQRTKKEGRFHD